MQSSELLLMITLVLLLSCWAVQGAEYYVSPDGDDTAAGTQDAPWKTLDKANETLQPGDTAIFVAGNYPGSIAPASSGTDDAPIAYRSEEPLAATLTAGEGTSAIEFSDRQHVIIESFRIDAGGVGGWFDVKDSEYLTVRGCVMRDAAPKAILLRSEQVKLLDNVFSKDRVTGNMWEVLECSRVLIEGNSFERVGHSPLKMIGSNYVVVRANSFQNPWGRNYEFQSTGRLLIERNVITRARDSGYSADSRAKNLYRDGIFRHNLVFGNLHTPLNSAGYLAVRATQTHWMRRPMRLMNSRIYNNTIAGNLGHGWEFGRMVASNDVVNNVFYRNDWAGGNVQITYSEGCSYDNRFLRNLVCGTEPGQNVVNYRGDTIPIEEADRRTGVRKDYWSEFHENVDADPVLLDLEGADLRLKPDSPAIDAGAPLALVMRDGEGRQLPVTDGIPFYDGFGIEGERGDWIAVGSPDTLARIERVELQYDQPAILHLDREMTWTEGAPVSLPWAGEAPDIGAYQYDTDHPARFIGVAEPTYPAPGEPVSFSIDTLGKTVQAVQWDFRDGTYSTELSPQHTWDEPGDHAVVVRAEFENGESSVEAVFVGVEEPLASGEPLIKADMEDATRETEWGYHFKFYRSWLTGYEHVEREIGEGRCMRLFMAPNKRNRAAGALAPGVWNIADYPIIRFEYRIPEGVPVGIVVEPFRAEDLPSGWMLGGTEAAEPGKYIEVSGPELIDDNQWHEAEVDLRAVREETPEVTHLYRFMFYCNWQTDEGQEFRFDNFYVLPE